MKLKIWQVSILLTLASYVICILAQSFPLWSTGQPFPFFPDNRDALIELVGFVAGVVAVYLVVRENIWNWPIGIVNVALYAYFFFAIAQHLANAVLQIIWFAYLIEGWYRWLRGGENKTELKITSIKRSHAIVGVVTIVLVTAILTPILTNLGGMVAALDALTAAISLAAQFLLNRKVLQSWILWIIVDIIYIPLYFYRGYYATMVLYVIFLGLAIQGWIAWNKTYRELQTNSQSATT